MSSFKLTCETCIDTPEDHLAKNQFIWLLDQLLYCCHHHLLYENNLKKSDQS